MLLPADPPTLAAAIAAHDRIGVISDMDGTLSPIAPRPELAQINPRARDLLAALAERLSLVALVSGRAVADLRELAGLPDLIYVGNHGLEQWIDGRVEVALEAQASRPALADALDELRPLMLPGMWIEDKGATATLHYRQTADPDAVRRAFEPLARAAADRHRLRMVPGQRVFELRPLVEIDKGTTFERLVRKHRLGAAVYLGDDVTDADALRMARRLRAEGACYAVAIGVESPATPDIVRAESDVLVEGINGVEDFLALLLDATG